MGRVQLAIIGGGLVGASLALALQAGARARGWRILLIEPFAPGSAWQPSYDARSSALTQSGAGLGLNAQFWVPFTGLAGELGVIGRFQHYAYEGAGARQTEDLSRAWLRVGARWRLPLPGHLYVAASYQEPLRKDRPVRLGSVADLESYLTAQGSGQEFERLWTFGAGLQF